MVRVGGAGAAHAGARWRVWSPQLEWSRCRRLRQPHSLPLGHKAAEEALQVAAQRGAMKPLTGKLNQVEPHGCESLWKSRIARGRGGEPGFARRQKRGSAAAPRKAKVELRKLEALIDKGRISRSRLEDRVKKALARGTVELRGEHHRGKREGANAVLCGGCRQAPRVREDPGGPMGAVNGSPPLEHWANRVRLPRSVECRGVVPQSEEGRRSPLGTVASMGRWIETIAHLRHCSGLMLVSLVRIALAPDARAVGCWRTWHRSRPHWCAR